jgi:hypothetical protein
MSAIWYPLGKKHVMRGEVALHSDTIIAILLSNAYTYNSLHEYRDDLTGEMAVITLTNKTVSDEGVFDADDGIFSVASPAVKAAIAIVKDTGSAATSVLLGFVNEGFSFGTTVSGSQPVTWDNGPFRILAITDP